MIERVRFTKKQIACLKQVSEDANKVFDENVAAKPTIYHEYERASFVKGYIEAFLEHVIKDGYSYLET